MKILSVLLRGRVWAVTGSVLAASLITACGGGGGGFPETSSSSSSSSSSNSTYTISNFETDVSSVSVLDFSSGDPDTSGTYATITHDTSGSHGTKTAAFTVSSTASSRAIGATSDGGLSDWSAYRYLKFDVTTTSDAFSGAIVLQSGASWHWCQGSNQTVAANSTGTITLDMSTCNNASDDLTTPHRWMMSSWGNGTFYVDNIRLEKDASASIATDLANGNTTSSTYTITSFRTGVSNVSVFKNDGNVDDGSHATIAHDTSGSHATNGEKAATFTVSTTAGSVFSSIGATSNGGLSDWSAYRYLKFDVKTGSDAFNGRVILQSGASWAGYCEGNDVSVAANSTGTVTLDMSTCNAAGGNDLTVPQRWQMVSWVTGTFYVDNIRLEK